MLQYEQYQGKIKNYAALIARSGQGSMALTWMKTLGLGVAMRRELLFVRRDDALLHEKHRVHIYSPETWETI